MKYIPPYGYFKEDKPPRDWARIRRSIKYFIFNSPRYKWFVLRSLYFRGRDEAKLYCKAAWELLHEPEYLLVLSYVLVFAGYFAMMRWWR